MSGCGCPEAGGLTRRSLLRYLASSGALAGVGTLGGEGLARRYAYADGTYDGDVLVVLSLHGGFDGLNAIVPAADPGYLAARPTIGIPASTLLPLDSTFGMHPAMAPLLPFWQAGKFGVVHAVGQADPTRSHFEAMSELERAAPGSAARTGWLDRTLGLRASGSDFAAMQVGSVDVPQSLAGPGPELAMRGIDAFALTGADDAEARARWAGALRALHADARAEVQAPAVAALGAVQTTARLAAEGYQPSGGASYPQTGLGTALRDVARLIKAGVGLQVACVDFGDWDMHAGAGTVQSGWMHDHLTELSRALAAFGTDLGERLDGVTVLTLSEFGRRVGENGSGGVDHGHGNAMLMLGGGIVGGRVHGAWPGLGDDALVDGDLAGRTDYRQVLAEILQKRCGLGSPVGVFPGLTADPLGVARAR